MPFAVSVVTPERVLFDGEAILVVARGLDGELGIQTGHAPILVALDVGRLLIREPEGNDVLFAVHGGFLDMKDNVCTVLADVAEQPDQIDVERARQAREHAQSTLADHDDAEALGALHRAVVRIDIAG